MSKRRMNGGSAAFESELYDLASGLSLLYMANHDDELPGRMRAAMESKDYGEVIHLSALMLNQGRLDGWTEEWMNEKWGKLSREFYAYAASRCAGVPDPQDGELARLRREVSSLRALARTALETKPMEASGTAAVLLRDEWRVAIIKQYEDALKEIAKEEK